MISTLSLLVTVFQAAPPALAPGVDQAFQAAVLQVEQQLAQGDFAGAATSLSAYPTNKVDFVWDLSNVPAESRPRFTGIQMQAIHDWNIVATRLTFAEAKKAPLTISFVKQNAINPDSRNIAPIVIKRTGGSIDAVISLSRGSLDHPVPSTDADLQKNVSQAFGAFLGVADLPYTQSVMSNIEVSLDRHMPVAGYEGMVAMENIAALDTLRKYSVAKTKITPASSSVSLTKASVSLPTMFKGEKANFDIEVANDGTGTAKLWVRPECGCTTAPGIVEIPPKSKIKVPIAFNSYEFEGLIKKHLYVISNDPAKAAEPFEFSVQINPVANFVSKSGDVAIIDDQPVDGEVFLLFNNKEPLNVKSVKVNGMPVEVSYEPWQGKMADGNGANGDKNRKGYRFKLKFPSNVPQGRTTSSMTVITDSAVWPYFIYNFFLQKGIAALPESLLMGKLTDVKKAKVLVTRPGKPFKILSVESDSPYFTASVDPATKNDEYSLTITYNANAPSGSLQKQITVHTDDPNQPLISVTVTGKIE